jgi:hypothetical protein
MNFEVAQGKTWGIGERKGDQFGRRGPRNKTPSIDLIALDETAMNVRYLIDRVGDQTMMVGHYGVSFAMKPTQARLPLWVWFIAVQWLDIVWATLVLLGIEKVRIIPGFTEATPLDLYYMPYTHGLPGSIVLSFVFGGFVSLFVAVHRWQAMLLVAAASFSHWVLDLIVHTPDLPLYDNSAKVGFGLWRHVVLSLPLELIILGLGAWVYARSADFTSDGRRYKFWGFIVALALLQLYANFGPPPATPFGLALTGLSSYGVLSVIAAWVERDRFAKKPTR